MTDIRSEEMTPPDVRLPELARRLGAALADRGVPYTHWKSNCRLGSRDGHEVELDLLVDPGDRDVLRSILGGLGFRAVVPFRASHTPDVFHYYAVESDGSGLVHVHVYHRVITGESLLKNYELPIRGLLLAEDRQLGGLSVPAPGIELVVFVVRAMIKHASPVERRLLYRDFRSVRDEVAWLVEANGAGLRDGVAKAADILPELDGVLIEEALGVLSSDVPVRRRNEVARKLRRALYPYRRFGPVTGFIRSVGQVYRRLVRKVTGAPAARGLASGGRVIAFVGAEAAGKSTLVERTAEFYGKAFAVRTVHFGKPPATIWTALPRLAVPTLRRLAPGSRPTRVEAAGPATRDTLTARPGLGRLMYAVRSVMLARERSSLARRVSAQARRGSVVLCDRFPSRVIGAADSPRLVPCGGSGLAGRLYDSLASRERRIYEAITPPDALIRLTLPLEEAVRRNEERIKAGKEAEDYVRQRHARAELLVYPGVRELNLDTGRDFDETLREARMLVWDAATGAARP